MGPKTLAVALLLLAAPALSSAAGYVVPTTSLAAEASNNTSAANGFASQSNGNRDAGSVSKLDVHSLLYSGATTKVYAHLMLWFGQSNHMNVGYSSTDPAQIKRQVEDMISRGIDGVVIDWYGPNNTIDQATQLVMAEAENHPGFTFAIMIDQGAIKWDSCPGCSPQQALIRQLQYIEQKYFPSPAYLNQQGRPVVTNFNIDISYSIDWASVNAALSTHPLFLFQNNNGFSHILSDGSYSWIMPTTNDYGMGYLSSFYGTGSSYPSELTMGAAYKGFNDTLAAWGSNRIMGQQCGQTWLQTFSEINGVYNAEAQLPDLQLVTWNDYEEGTEIESGIDNCLTLSASVAENTLQWSTKGDESTVGQYTVFISSDGENLMPLNQLTAGFHSLNLCSFPIPSGTYELFVKAVGKPGLANHMTAPVTYIPGCQGGAGSSTFSLIASPSTAAIPAGQSGTLRITANPQSGAFNSPISLSCAGLPSGWTCSFSPATLTPGSSSVASSLTIADASRTGMNLRERGKSGPIPAGWLLPLGIAGFAFLGWTPCGRSLRSLTICALIGIAITITSCGGGGNLSRPAPGVYTIAVNGTSGSLQFSTTVTLIVE